MENIFNMLLGEQNSNNITRDIKSYAKQNPKNIVFIGEIYNINDLVWSGQLDITNQEGILKGISEKLDTLLNVVNVGENKTVISFNKGRTILSIDYKNIITRDTKTKVLINI